MSAGRLVLRDDLLASIRDAYRREAGLSGISSSDVAAFVRSQIRSVRFRSAFTPPVTWLPGETAPAAPDDGGGTVALSVVKPAVDVELASGQTITVAPYGEPTTNYFPLVVGVGGVLVAVSTFFLVRSIVRRSRARR